MGRRWRAFGLAPAGLAGAAFALGGAVVPRGGWPPDAGGFTGLDLCVGSAGAGFLALRRRRFLRRRPLGRAAGKRQAGAKSMSKPPPQPSPPPGLPPLVRARSSGLISNFRPSTKT